MTSGDRLSAVRSWTSQVETHHAQSLAIMDQSTREGDFWRGLAPRFRADPHRSDDEALNAILGLLDEKSTVLDVGGGAGRFSIALSFKCEHVTVVDPSEAMLEQLRESSAEDGASNIGAVRSEWESAEVDSADLVLCSHVVYGVADIKPFIQKLDSHANKTVVIVSFVDSPQANLASLWEPVHGEKRINLPALPELVNVLWEMDIYPNIDMLTETRTQSFDDLDAARDEMMRRLFIGENPVKEERLADALEEHLEETEDGFRIKGARPIRQGVVWWSPTRSD